MNSDVLIAYELYIDGNNKGIQRKLIEINKPIATELDIDEIEYFLQGDNTHIRIYVIAFTRLEEQPNEQDSRS